MRQEQLTEDLCWEIDHLTEQLKISRLNEKEWRDKYSELLNGSLKHGEQMMGSWITFLVSDNVRIMPTREAEK